MVHELGTISSRMKNSTLDIQLFDTLDVDFRDGVLLVEVRNVEGQSGMMILGTNRILICLDSYQCLREPTAFVSSRCEEYLASAAQL